jgi:CBS domain-containing membrane protein
MTESPVQDTRRLQLTGMSDRVRGLGRRLQMQYLMEHQHSRWLLALFGFVNGCLAIAIMALAALATDEPFIFPSLGPTAFLFFYTPLAATAAPRNTIIGHLLGATMGWVSLAIFGLTDEESAFVTGVTVERVFAAGLSLGLTSSAMILVDAPHPPAGATTLIVSLGVLTELDQLLVLMLAVVMLTALAFVINRFVGIPYPLWRAPRQIQA